MLKDISGYPHYYASEDGHIYCDLPMGAQTGSGNLRKLKPNVQTSGKYLYISIKNEAGKRTTKRVHRLVCEAFHGAPKPGDTASHLDGNWKNNAASNLKWENLSLNNSRKKDHGTDDAGTNNSRALLDVETLAEIRKLLNSGKTHLSIGEQFGVSRVFITKIANNYRYKGQ